MNDLVPVVLAGGSGTRLWPLSRQSYPKQFLSLVGDDTLFQSTLKRAQLHESVNAPWLVCHESHLALAERQAADINCKLGHFILEPEPRNTAPAIAAAAYCAQQRSPDAVLLVLPADHIVDANDRYMAAVDAGLKAAREGYLVAFGITPARPETGYGYIRGGPAIAPSVLAVDRFSEKPDRPTAERFLQSGDYYWNSGMFLFRADRYLEELDRLEKDMARNARRAVDKGIRFSDCLLLDGEAFAQCTGTSIDYAVMEKTGKAALVVSEFAWSDVGSWDALYALQAGGGQTVTRGPSLVIDSPGTYLQSDGPMITAIGLKDIVVVASNDAVLVADRGRCQDIRTVVDQLKAGPNRKLVKDRDSEDTAWGRLRRLSETDAYSAYELTLAPAARRTATARDGHETTLLVKSGTVRIDFDGQSRSLAPSEGLRLPPGVSYVMQNSGAGQATVDEVSIKSAILNLSGTR